ncbi:hypothetical protein Clacol_006535 [Clathrus columnatus]|uniref:Uncharacterized protein n=1 Tax=Clathrus columnatus TaxID=1419009 RepID=A0AAV5AHY5_9AGAM|nr:hypothetical protein Clacol_006535 [Clathrus columnatus]
MPPPLSTLLSTPTATTISASDSISVLSSPLSLPPFVVHIQDNNSARLLDVSTTTVFVDAGPTVTANASSSSKVPVGAIVGGLLGGAAIALLAVGGWIWWGKVIERKARRDREHHRASTPSSLKREGGSRHASGSLNGKYPNGRESARTSKRSLQQGVHPLLAAATASQKSVTFADDEVTSTHTPAVNRDGSEVKISISIAERDKLSDKEKDSEKPTSADPIRGFSIRGPSPTPPPTRRSHSSERGYVPTRRSPLGQSFPSPSSSPNLLSRKRTPSAPQPGTGESLSNLGTNAATEKQANGGFKSSPPGARSMSVLPIFGTKDSEQEREELVSSLTNNSKLFLTRTPISKNHTQTQTQTHPTVSPLRAPSPVLTSQPRSQPVPPSPAKASVSLNLPGGPSLPSLTSLPLTPSPNPGSVNEALAALSSSFDLSPLAQPKPAFRQGTYASSSATKTNSSAGTSGVSGASESVVSAPSMYSQDGTATDIDPRLVNRR